MNYIVLDLEWNRPVNPELLVRNGESVLNSEIIQIGAVKLDSEFNPIDDICLYIKPKFYKTLSKKITKLTKITDEMLRMSGFFFENAVLRFKKWCGDDSVFLTWGSDDRGVFLENLSIHRISSDWLPKAYDLQVLFATQISCDSQRHNLTSALECLSETGLPPHNALNDAKNTVLVCNHLDLARGLAEYDETITGLTFVSPVGEASKSYNEKGVYPTKRDACEAARNMKILCPECGKELNCSDIIYINTKYITIADCDCDGAYYVRIKPFECLDGTYSLNVTFFNLTDEIRESYIRKREKYFEKLRKLKSGDCGCAIAES